MNDTLLATGRIAGVVGALVCAGALAVRLTGHYTFAGFEIGTLFLGGIAAMVAGCFCLLLRLAPRS
jgi:hypothetical protein